MEIPAATGQPPDGATPVIVPSVSLSERLSTAQQLILARVIITLCCLPLPIVAIIVALVQPDALAAMKAHLKNLQFIVPNSNQALPSYIGFLTFGTVVLLLAYHALMLWYNPFIADDKAAQRKRRIINGVSLLLSVPTVSGLLLTSLDGGQSGPNPILGAIQDAATNFPFQLGFAVLLILAVLGWVVWFAWAGGWLYRFAHLPQTESAIPGVLARAQRSLDRLNLLWHDWRGKALFFIVTFILFSSLLSMMTQSLALALGFTTGALLAGLQVTVADIFILLDIVLLRGRGLGWVAAAWSGVSGGVIAVIAAAHGIQEPVPGWLVWLVIVEIVAGLLMLLFWLGLVVRNAWQAWRLHLEANLCNLHLNPIALRRPCLLNRASLRWRLRLRLFPAGRSSSVLPSS